MNASPTPSNAPEMASIYSSELDENQEISHDATTRTSPAETAPTTAKKQLLPLSEYLSNLLLNHDLIQKYTELEEKQQQRKEQEAEQQASRESDSSAAGQQQKERQMMKLLRPLVEKYRELIQEAVGILNGSNRQHSISDGHQKDAHSASADYSEFNVDVYGLKQWYDRKRKENSDSQHQSNKEDSLFSVSHLRRVHQMTQQSSTASGDAQPLNIIQESLFEFLTHDLVPHMQKKLWSTAVMAVQRKKVRQQQRNDSALSVEDEPNAATRSKSSATELNKSNLMHAIRQTGREETLVELADWSLLEKRRRALPTLSAAQLWIKGVREYRQKQDEERERRRVLEADEESIAQRIRKDKYFVISSLMKGL